MIPDVFLGIVGLLIDGLVLLLPSVDLPFWDRVEGFADDASRFLFTFDGLLPMADYITTIRLIAVVWLPGYLTYRVVRWCVAHLPFLNIGGN